MNEKNGLKLEMNIFNIEMELIKISVNNFLHI